MLPPPRDLWIDVARGAAVVLMVIHHVATFHDNVNGTHLAATPPVMLAGIVARTTFVMLMGYCAARQQHQHHQRPRPWRRRAHHTLQLALAAMAVTAATAGNVRFGVLHYATIATAILGAWPINAAPLAAFSAAVAATNSDPPVGVPAAVAEVVFGVVRRGTFDLFPLAKWWPVSVLGFLLGAQRHSAVVPRPPPPRALGPLAWVGARSLPVYLVHLVVLAMWFGWAPGWG